MNEYSQEQKNKTSTCDSLAEQSCPLSSCSCLHDQKLDLVSLERHYHSEQHQKNLIRTLQGLNIEQNNDSSTTCPQNDEKIELYNLFHEKTLLLVNETQLVADELVQSESYAIGSRNLQQLAKEGLEYSQKAAGIQKANIDALQINSSVLACDLSSIQNQIGSTQQSQPRILVDGMMVWRISNVQEKIYDAQSERRPSFYLEPFFTSSTGYKLTIRLYFNGDGTARGTHVSIFLVILRGPYDSLLKWPFTFRVSFCLVDQRALLEPDPTRRAKPVIDSFRPDPTSSSFQKPIVAMNIASGIPKFVSLNDFNQPSHSNRYCIADTIFLKLYVDFIDLPKSMLPFIFDLDMGLPTAVRQHLIEKEMKQRQMSNTSQMSQ